ncbi:Transposon Tf2-6 polyprotein-like 1 [Homarus americanus]|uniref:Transposon Tf2-6 polyprotein-like 1 n=1 Tax=Homarus americanus TaxID=6706 RepID=A0A8J5JE50_HOMAM|nr:Transposon Tf2-6 polyprotein-like 1 [Homarus americanus]
MGIASAAEQGQRLLQQILQKYPNCRNRADDILVWGKDTSEHNSALEKVLQKLKENNLTISQHKSVFHIDEVEFHGFTVSKEGIKPTDKKIEAVKRFRRPEAVQEVRSFLGLINYLTGFIPRLATSSEPLKNLTRMNSKWTWTEKEERNTPHSMTGETPAKLLMGRNIKVKLLQGDAKSSGDSGTDGSHKTAERTDNTHRNRENNQAANTPRTGMDKSRQDGNSEEEPLTARRPRRTIVKPKKYQDGAEDFGTDGSKSSGTDDVDDSEMDGETSDEYEPDRSWN